MLTRVEQIVTAAHRLEILHAHCTDLLMNPDRVPKTRSVWPTLRIKIAHQKVGMTGHFQASWASRPVRCLLTRR